MNSSIFELVKDEDCPGLERHLSSGGNANEIYSDLKYEHDLGITPIYIAILSGNVKILSLLIEYGANVNHSLNDDFAAHYVYAENPMSLALQARFLMCKEKYSPVVEILESNGARDET